MKYLLALIMLIASASAFGHCDPRYFDRQCRPYYQYPSTPYTRHHQYQPAPCAYGACGHVHSAGCGHAGYPYPPQQSRYYNWSIYGNIGSYGRGNHGNIGFGVNGGSVKHR